MPALTRRATLALAAAAAAARRAWAADAYPSRPVIVVVPFAAGGSADVYARLLAPPLQAAFGQPFVIDDKPGAGSIIGTEVVKNAAPDGQTLLLISNTHTVNETLFATKPFALMRDFEPVAPINQSDLVLVVRPGLDVRSVAELIARAKQDPGGLSYASSGPGTPYHMAGELFKQMAGVDILHVPYRGSSPARVDVVGGQVDMMFDAITTMSGFIRAGKVTALATTGLARSAALPDLPTVAETVAGYEATIWLGLVAPKNTPAAIVDRLNAVIGDVAGRADTKAAWAKDGAVPMVMTAAAFRLFMEADIAKWAKVVKISGAKPDQ